MIKKKSQTKGSIHAGFMGETNKVWESVTKFVNDNKGTKLILVDIGVNDCEKFYPSFQMVLWENSNPSSAAEACLMETVGQA